MLSAFTNTISLWILYYYHEYLLFNHHINRLYLKNNIVVKYMNNEHMY